MSHKVYRLEKNCLNCGTIVEEKFCPQCGQENTETRLKFLPMVSHFVSDFFHFDSKFFRSLIPLFTRPGFLTLEYWKGRRVRYVDPLRLFFFVAIIFMISTTIFYNRYGEQIKRNTILGDRELAKYDDEAISSLDETEAARITKLKVEENQTLEKFYKAFDFVFQKVNYLSFFLLPVYALVFKLLYIRRKSFYVDHVIYTVHLQSFMYLLLAIVFLLPFITPLPMNYVLLIVVLAGLMYVVISLRRIYHQNWFKTIIKSLIAVFSLLIITVSGMSVFLIIDALVF